MKWKVVSGLEKYLGIMFKWKSPGLIFIFDKPTSHPIHSYFCRTFKAKWFNYSGELIEEQIVKPFRSNIKPSKAFSFLTEEILYQ